MSNGDDKPWVRHWSRHAQSYDEKVYHVVGRGTHAALTAKLLSEGSLGNALELACGTGEFTRIITHTADHVTATDLSDQMLRVARAKLADRRNLTFQKADCEATGLPSARFDTVLMANVIAALDEPKALAECLRLLKPGGRLFIINYTFRMAFLGYLRFGFKSVTEFGIPPRGRKDPTPEELSQQAAAAGFKVETAEVLGEGVKAVYVRARKPESPTRAAAKKALSTRLSTRQAVPKRR